MKKIIRLFFLLICINGFSQLDLIETDDMKLVTYDFGHKYILPHATRCFHVSLDFHKKLFDYQPSEKITVLIQDFGDYGNAGATAVPRNAISMGLSPFSYAFENSPAGERVFSMMNHELVHVMALDHASDSDRFYRNLFFGKVDPSNHHPISMFYSYLTTPRRYSPRWYHEGLASYVETWMGGGLGLALGSYDEMVFRTKVLEKDRIYSAMGLESEGVTSDFQGRSNSYLYGTRFMGYLAYKYGPDKIIEWGKRGNGSRRSFAAQFKNVIGEKIETVWNEWIEFEKDWQGGNLNSIRENEVTKPELISNSILGSVSFPHYDKKRNKIYVAVNYPGKIPYLASLDISTGKLDHLTDIKGAALFYVTSLTYDEESDLLFFTTDNDAWRDLNSYDLKSGKTRRLQKDFRTGDLGFNPVDKSVWGIKHLHGRSSIVKIPKSDPSGESEKPYSSWIRKLTLPYGHDIFDIDISPDGKKLSAAVSDLRGNQSLILYDLEALEDGREIKDTIQNFEPASPQSFRFSDDGKYLIGCSYYSGVSNVYQVDLETNRVRAMSNAETGFFRPLIIDEDQIFVFNFSSKGFQPAFIPNSYPKGVSAIDFLGKKTKDKFPVLGDWELPFPKEADYDVNDEKIKRGKYLPGKMIQLNYAYPTLVGYKDNIGIGYHLNFSDPLKLKTAEISFSLTPKRWRNGWTDNTPEEIADIDDNEIIHFSVDADFGSISFHGGYNEANFYDLFGPTQFSRRGLALEFQYQRSLIWDSPKNLDLALGTAMYYGLDQSPAFQQIEAPGFDETYFFDFDASLSYRNLRNSLGAVDHEKGIRASLTPALTLSSGNVFARVIGTFDFGFQLPVNHTSLWFRNAAGHSFQEDFNPFTRFGFASFGNNYVDFRTFRRYRTPFAFPGLRFDEDVSIIARSFVKNTAELVLPPFRFRKFGTFNFFVNWIQPTIFSSYLSTSAPSIEDSRFIDLGLQVDTRFVSFSLLPSTLSIGFARAWDLENKRSFDEFMISLKLLR